MTEHIVVPSYSSGQRCCLSRNLRFGGGSEVIGKATRSNYGLHARTAYRFRCCL